MCKECHVVLVKARIKSLHALARACKRIGGELKPHQKTFNWWGRWVGDYHADDAAYKNGVSISDYGKCDHAIHFPGKVREVGLIAQEDGSFNLIFDFVGDINHLIGGKEMHKLLAAYSVEAAIEEAQNQCATYQETLLEDGSIQIKINIHE